MWRQVYFRLGQMELEMTHLNIELRDKEAHMDNADHFLEAALRNAHSMKQVALLDHIRFEQSCLRGRRLEMRAKRVRDKRVAATAVDVAKQEIETAMRRLQVSAHKIYLENLEYGNEWLDRLTALS